MRSDIIHVKSNGEGIKEALQEAESVAAYKGLSEKNAGYLRLLTEELTGMIRSLSNVYEDVDTLFYIEDHDKKFTVTVTKKIFMTSEIREKLLAFATTGSNSAVKGIMSRIRDIFVRAMEPMDEGTVGVDVASVIFPFEESSPMAAIYPETNLWSLTQYREAVNNKEDNKEDMEELERSIVANIADEVKVFIQNDQVKVVAYKDMN